MSTDQRRPECASHAQPTVNFWPKLALIPACWKGIGVIWLDQNCDLLDGVQNESFKLLAFAFAIALMFQLGASPARAENPPLSAEDRDTLTDHRS